MERSGGASVSFLLITVSCRAVNIFQQTGRERDDTKNIRNRARAFHVSPSQIIAGSLYEMLRRYIFRYNRRDENTIRHRRWPLYRRLRRIYDDGTGDALYLERFINRYRGDALNAEINFSRRGGKIVQI